MCVLTIAVVLHVRYEDMTAAVKQLAEEKPELTGTHTRITPYILGVRKLATGHPHTHVMPRRPSVEERNLLSVAYKNVVGAARASWRVLTSVKAKQSDASKVHNEEVNVVHGGCAIHHVGSLATPQLAIIDSFIAKVEKELSDKCAELLALVDHLVKTNPDTQATVFYLKMAGGAFAFCAVRFCLRLCFCCCCCYTHKLSLSHTHCLSFDTAMPCVRGIVLYTSCGWPCLVCMWGTQTTTDTWLSSSRALSAMAPSPTPATSTSAHKRPPRT